MRRKGTEIKALWRREGIRSVAHWMASKTGTAVGPAIASLEMVGRLADLPVVAEAFLAGRLSEAQAREIAARTIAGGSRRRQLSMRTIGTGAYNGAGASGPGSTVTMSGG